MYIYIYIYIIRIDRRRPNGYFARRVPSLSPASSFRRGSNGAVLKCVLPLRARYPLS